MSYIPERNRKRNLLWCEELKNGFSKFVEEKNWKYDFANEINQPKRQDAEARYLSQYFFQNIIQCIDSSLEVEITDDRYMYVRHNDSQTIFHFDIMNNPKIKHAFGKNIKSNCEFQWQEWDGIYHTVGNITPIPWPKLKYGNINTQELHKALDERWDLFLQLCKNEWTIWENYSVTMSFECYMKITCQQMYYKKVLLLIKDRLDNRYINNVTDEELIEWFQEWNKFDYKDEELISFDEDLINTVEDILLVIEIRGRLMLKILDRGMNEQSKEL